MRAAVISSWSYLSEKNYTYGQIKESLTEKAWNGA